MSNAKTFHKPEETDNDNHLQGKGKARNIRWRK